MRWYCCWYFVPVCSFLCVYLAFAKGQKAKRMHFQLWWKKMCIWWLKIFPFLLIEYFTYGCMCMCKWKSGCKRNPFEERKDGSQGKNPRTCNSFFHFLSSFGSSFKTWICWANTSVHRWNGVHIYAMDYICWALQNVENE